MKVDNYRRSFGSRKAWACALVLLYSAVASVTFAQEGRDALAAFRDDRYAEALEITALELEANPQNIESIVVRGWTLLALDRYQEAVDLGLRGLQVNQFESRILQIVGQAHYQLGNWLQALEYLERYVQVAPTGAYIDWVYFAMGEIFLTLEEFHRADIALSTSVFHNSRSAARWARLGYVREQLADWEYALQAYERALQLDPSFGDAVRGHQRVRAEIQG
ncbi:MAG: tetratricopeptide repeat protein [Spirochaetales bacterium]